MFKCEVCGTELPDGAKACPGCLVVQEPPAKFEPGTLVKLVMDNKGEVMYNYVVDSYFNQDVQMRLYRLHEFMGMPVWREDWLQEPSDAEIAYINNTGRLKPRKHGGWVHPLEEALV